MYGFRNEDDGQKPSTSSCTWEGNVNRSVKMIHHEMIDQLSRYISKDMESWKRFTNMLEVDLDRVEINSIHSVGEACSKLMEKTKIKYGQYTVLSEIFSKIEQYQCLEVVNDFTKRIKLKEEEISKSAGG